jgi:hypothetical protein
MLDRLLTFVLCAPLFLAIIVSGLLGICYLVLAIVMPLTPSEGQRRFGKDWRTAVKGTCIFLPVFLTLMAFIEWLS